MPEPRPSCGRCSPICRRCSGPSASAFPTGGWRWWPGNALSIEEQERVIGRTKLPNVELPDDVKPSNSHVALNTIVEPDGTQRQILRDNMPFGSVGDAQFGTYFIGYSSTPDVTEHMLQRIFIGEPPGNYDRILDFSTPLTGTLFFVPTIDFLENQPPPPQPGAAGGAQLGSSWRMQGDWWKRSAPT